MRSCLWMSRLQVFQDDGLVSSLIEGRTPNVPLLALQRLIERLQGEILCHRTNRESAFEIENVQLLASLCKLDVLTFSVVAFAKGTLSLPGTVDAVRRRPATLPTYNTIGIDRK